MSIERDKQAFTGWIKAHQQALYRHAYWMSSDATLAADLVSETFYQAWRDRATLRDESRVRAWLLSILRHNTYREFKQRPSLQDYEEDCLKADNGDRDALIDLSRLLAGLSHAHREVLLLHALHGFSYAQISEQLNLPLGTVMSRVSRARQSLKTQRDETDTGHEAKNVIPLTPDHRSKHRE